MQTHRIVIALNLSQKPPIAVQTRRSSQTAGWGLDIKKNFRPPPWVKFVLDIPFHRTLSPAGAFRGRFFEYELMNELVICCQYGVGG